MFDRFNRHIHYLRISVTDRCNLRCHYCMPEEGVEWMPRDSILGFGEIVEVVRAAAGMGINKIRLTGGEPLVRKGIISLVQMIASVEGISEVAMTTNGLLLTEHAVALKAAGLTRINISLDTLDPDKFSRITRGGDLNRVLQGIETAKEAGLMPVKINCVISESSSEPDAVGVKEYCDRNGLQVRFIREMNLHQGSFSVVEGGEGGNCKICNRLRLTANGMVKPCLFSDSAFSVREMGAERALLMALDAKPLEGCSGSNGKFYQIGG